MPTGLRRVLLLLLMALWPLLTSACAVNDHGHGEATPPALIGAPSLQIGRLQLEPTRGHAPGDDFYTFVNKDWLAGNNLPADKLSAGASEDLMDENNQRIREMMEELLAFAPSDHPVGKKMVDLYISALDENAVEARGVDPLEPHLSRIRAVSSMDELTRLMGVIGYNSPIGLAIGPGPSDPDRNAIWLSQAGLGLPHRGFYLRSGEDSLSLQDAYRDYVAKILSLLGHPDAANGAARIYALERVIAEAHSSEDSSLGADDLMRSMSLAELKEFAPAFRWDLFLEGAGLAGSDHFVVLNRSAVRDISKEIDGRPLDDWKLWLQFSFANDFADYLPQAFSEAKFDFYARRMSGVSAMPPRWEFAVSVLNAHMGEAMGQMFVRQYVPAHHKQIITSITDNIRAAFAAHLWSLEWMDNTTRKAALDKLEGLRAMIAYPDSWRDFTSYQVKTDRLFENIYNSYVDTWNRQTDSLSRSVDRTAWPTYAHAVNAFYNPLSNSFVLPAGLLRPPFFDPEAEAAANFGGIGAVIGHEISHGFDDLGRQFDTSGRSVDWWSDDTDARFAAMTERLSAQYDAYCPFPDTCVNGAATLSENIADLAGLEIAYAAYRRSLGGKTAPVVNGMTGDQQFFIAYAKTFREHVQEETARRELDTAGHAPGRYRVNGVVRNMDAWYSAFDVRPGDRLYLPPSERVRIW